MAPWQIVTSSAAGSLIALIGVFAGAVLSTRLQRQHWARDKLAETCRDLVQEATRIQRALWRRWEDDSETTEWVGWNQALAALWLFGNDQLTHAAAKMDETFFRVHHAIRAGEIHNLKEWQRARDEMEDDRLEFINVARCGVFAVKENIDRPLNSRPDVDSPTQGALPATWTQRNSAQDGGDETLDAEPDLPAKVTGPEQR